MKTYPLFHRVELAEHELNIDEDDHGTEGKVERISLDGFCGQVAKTEQRNLVWIVNLNKI
jgi:hypothetical protein